MPTQDPISKIPNPKRASRAIQVVEHLASNCEVLSSNPSNIKNKKKEKSQHSLPTGTIIIFDPCVFLRNNFFTPLKSGNVYCCWFRTHFSAVTWTSVFSSCTCVLSLSVRTEKKVLILLEYCFVLVCLSIVLLL
jgi:hypothetical protein